MKKTISLLIILIMGVAGVINLTGCYYDKQVTPIGCDSANMTYTKNIQSILVTNCTTCHYAGNSVAGGGGYNFEAYNGIKAMATNGRLLPAINHAAGAPPMPKNSPTLSTCDIAKFTNWVQHGAPQ